MEGKQFEITTGAGGPSAHWGSGAGAFKEAEPFVNEDLSHPSEDDVSSFDLVSEKEDRQSHIADLVQTIKETADKLAVD